MENMNLLEENCVQTINPGALKEAMRQAGATSGNIWTVEIGQLHIIPDFNLRVRNDQYASKIAEYEDSLAVEGWMRHKPMTTIILRDENTGKDLIYVMDGHTRLLAIPGANVKRAANGLPPIEEVTMIVMPSKRPHSNEPITLADLTVSMVQGNKANPHNPYECSIACKRLLDAGHTPSEIARRLGFSTEWVSNLLLVANAPRKLRERLATETLTVTLAVQLLKEHGDVAADMVEEAVGEKEAAGKPARVTLKNLAPKSKFQKVLKRSAPRLYETLGVVTKDPAFNGLNVETREKLLALFDELEKLKVDTQVDHSKQTTIFDGDVDAETMPADSAA